MESIAPPRKLVENPRYTQDRETALAGLSIERIDAPIRSLVAAFARLPYCFTMQSCYGHFVHDGQPELENLEPAPTEDVGMIQYRIAYMAFCLERSSRGESLRRAFSEVPSIDPQYIQFASPDWFWKRHLNSYALQVEPSRLAHEDSALIGHQEALHVQEIRDRFFDRLTNIAGQFLDEDGTP